MKRNILGLEQNIRNNKDEQVHIFDDKGNKVQMLQGKGAEVKLNGYKVPKDSIITHNHPRSLGEKGIKRIGNSFSEQDILIAVYYNAKEVRAVTPTYTFSMKRPPGGWKATPRQIQKEMNNLAKAFEKEGREWIAGRADKSHFDRFDVTGNHRIMKGLAKKFGWIYTKKNS